MFFLGSMVILLINNVNMGYSIGQSLKRRVLIRQKNLCGCCKSKFSKFVPHEIHHLNHIASDNNSSNLVALCANCHSAHHRFNISVQQMFVNGNNYTQCLHAYDEFID